MQGRSDPFNRYAYPWGKEDAEMLSFFKKAGEVRKNSLPLTRGDTEILYADSGIFAIKRSFCGKTVLAVSFAAGGEYAVNGEYTDLITNQKFINKIYSTCPATFILQED
jgi:hypothetical protein